MLIEIVASILFRSVRVKFVSKETITNSRFTQGEQIYWTQISELRIRENLRRALDKSHWNSVYSVHQNQPREFFA
jgi:hypothetical protein